MAKILWNESHIKPIEEQQFTWENLISLLVSLPERTANKLQSQNSEIFYPKAYIPKLASNIYQTLLKVHGKLKQNQDVTLEFTSTLIGKLCLSGNSDLLWSTLIPRLTCHVREDYIWCRMCSRLVTGVPERCIEVTLVTLLQHLSWYGLVDRFLGDSVLKKQKIKYILCTKILLFRHSEKILLLQNTLGYLASSHTRRHLFINCFKELLGVWGDKSALRHTSMEQHIYITKALFICMGFISKTDKDINKEEILHLLMPGVECHIGNSDHHIRKVGMILAETLTAIITPMEKHLKFEIERDEEVDALVALTTPPEDPGVNHISSEIESLNVQEERNNAESPSEAEPNADSDLDSDDDLVPYDMSCDKKVSKVKTPKYLRECMEGLISNDDPERLEVCLNTTESLIRKDLPGLKEIAEEFSKILLHMSDRYSTNNFASLRFKCMVALAVSAPIQVSSYLTKEFYERNYNLRQRMDILEILAAAAQEMSQPATKKSSQGKPEESSNSSTQTKVVGSPQQSWKDIVQQRIESKTRRFATSHTKPEASANKFAAVAGNFFYPLMTHFDRKENTFDLLGEDSLVLARLIYTLGVIIYSAIHTNVVRQMGSCLMEFLWVLRFHSDQSVRHSILFAISMVFLSVPGHILLSDLQPEVLETKRWLEDVVEKDNNTESKSMAIQCLVILENVIKQWKQRWCVIKKPSPAADCLHVQLYKDVRVSTKWVQPKSSFYIECFYGLETGIRYDKENHVIAVICQKQVILLAFENRESVINFEIKIRRSLGEEDQFPVQISKVPTNSKLPLETVRMLIHGQKFCFVTNKPPKVLASWQLTELRKFGMSAGKFVFEGGKSCGRGAGVHVLTTDQADEIEEILQQASEGKTASCSKSNKRRSQAFDHLEPMRNYIGEQAIKDYRNRQAFADLNFLEDNRRHKRHSFTHKDYSQSSDLDCHTRLTSIENIVRERQMSHYDIPPQRIRKVESFKRKPNQYYQNTQSLSDHVKHDAPHPTHRRTDSECSYHTQQFLHESSTIDRYHQYARSESCDSSVDVCSCTSQDLSEEDFVSSAACLNTMTNVSSSEPVLFGIGMKSPKLKRNEKEVGEELVNVSA
ncbi:hypothetical protein FSP39_020836 [Pinctada imbricata]|uniref:IRS-type PTB domain-containing protein n=1 Tax=Pinctada imbricata TaxID=66713 RepID=A0AA88Y2U3_PINIB|nr:hypothetical protein FSP39_020836 [Pinctada imbricata]